ncbi:MAG TPA: GH1 family beta-glucosidase [Burkholderiaceae bacterium]|nr:GH1 family beta-glucosidase [Burkholderiaceae bacterium]
MDTTGDRPGLVHLPADSPIRRPDFLFGVATSAYQIEGAAEADGRLPSIWDTFSKTPGKVLHGDTGAVACDHYHRWEQDVELIAGLGVDAYRLSLAWPRVMTAEGQPNHKGLDFYKRLLDRLQEKGIQRYVTLYHWDLPQWMEDRGGWLNRETAYRFADYADLVSRELAGRVSSWATLNEPWCSAFLGYGNGHHAPGLASHRYATQALHHLLLGHGLALPLIRSNDPGVPAGVVANVGAAQPLTDTPEDREAARLYEVQHNAWILDPLLEGRYPSDLFRLWPGTEPLVLPGDLDVMSRPLDFLGINYYYRVHVRSDGRGGYTPVELEGLERTPMGWEVHPQSLQRLLIDFKRTYRRLPPIYITENGAAADDRLEAGRVRDPSRIDYIDRHLAAVDGALREGVDVRGYFVWSLMDNFEWAFGYERRFGLVHVDYATQQRTLKDSGLTLRDFLAARRRQA